MKAPTLLRVAFRYFRSQRMRRFERTFAVTPDTRILDVGGSPHIWQYASVRPRVTIANLPSAVHHGNERITQVACDGCILPFPDQSFDIVFSNSVIEHVGAHNQRRFAREVARVGRRYWIQTPNRGFPLEMHVMLPFVHRLPKRWQRFLLEHCNVWEAVTQPTPEQKKFFKHHFLNDLQLLNASELRSLFPEARIITERVLGLSKSLIAVRA